MDGFGTTGSVERADGIANAGNAGFVADTGGAGVPNVKPPNGFAPPPPPTGVDAAGAVKDTEEKTLLSAGVPVEVADGFFPKNLFVVVVVVPI